MSSLVLPSFSGTDVAPSRTAQNQVTVHKTVSGKEQRTIWGSPRRAFHVRHNALRSSVFLTTGSFSGSSELSAFVSLHQQVSGTFDSFQMEDPLLTGTLVQVRFMADPTLRQVYPGCWETEYDVIEVL